MAGYVILSHDHPFQHWDLMLEYYGRLRTWRLAAPPTPEGFLVTAEAIGDHRLDYLDYEGTVSGNRGTVTRWDRGEFSLIIDDNDEFQGCLNGERLRGLLTLGKLEGQEWACHFFADESV